MASLSAILRRSRRPTATPYLATEILSDSTKPASRLEERTRKSLFDKSRDQVPLSKVRDFLSGSGGGAALSQQLDGELASYIDPKKLAASRTRASMNEGVAKTAHNFEGNIKSQEVQPREKAPGSIAGPKSALSPAVLVERQQTEPGEEQKAASPAGVRPPPGIRVAPANYGLGDSDAADEDEDGQRMGRLDARRTSPS